jgi:hypothetical protein
VRLRGALAVISDLDLQVVSQVPDRDGRGCWAGVTQGVGQGFLDDPVGRQLDPGREVAFEVAAQTHGQPSSRHVGDQCR